MNKITTEWVEITPEIAKNMLADAQGFRNRRPDLTKVKTYAADMAKGNWRRNGETIIFDADGICIDGQHRLMAIVESGATVWALCASGVAREDAKTINQGKSRTIANSLQMDGVKNASRMVAAARTLHEFRGGVDPSCQTGQRHAPNMTLRSVAEVEEFLSTHARGLADMVDMVPGAAERVGSASEFAAVAFELSIVESQAAALDWLAGMGGGCAIDDPRQVLRDRMMEDRLVTAERRRINRTVARIRDQRINLMVQSWNLWIGGHQADRMSLQLRSEAAFRIVVPLSAEQARARQADQVNRASVVHIRGYSRDPATVVTLVPRPITVRR